MRHALIAACLLTATLSPAQAQGYVILHGMMQEAANEKEYAALCQGLADLRGDATPEFKGRIDALCDRSRCAQFASGAGSAKGLSDVCDRMREKLGN
jgi:hypothetical protein